MTVTSLLKRLVPQRLYPSAILRRSVVRQTSRRVLGGPFVGMQFVDKATWGAYVPKLIGTYELELRDVLERAISRAPEHVVDIGGAEGYYAVGLLLRLPKARLVVFEQQAEARAVLSTLARLNGVDARLDIRESCEPSGLEEALRSRSGSLVVCDVEGYEAELLDPERVPALASADLLVEVHDSRVPGCRDLVLQRFARTHHATAIAQRPRTMADYPLSHTMARVWPQAIVKYGLNEFRSPLNSWVYLERRSAS